MLNQIVEFFSNLDDIDCWPDGTGVEDFPFQNTPSDFLEFAENDLKQKVPQAAANALANAKRALDCQLDYFLVTYGLSQISKQQKWSTGKKISLMGDIGIVPQSIFHKVNMARNNLEHRYELPSVLTAENSTDIVGLFVAATDLYLFPARYSTYFEKKERAELSSKETRKSNYPGLWLAAREPLSYIRLEMLMGETIGAAGKLHGVSFEYMTSPEVDLNDYLFLLTFILHSHRINTSNPAKFFSKLKYAQADSQNGGEQA